MPTEKEMLRDMGQRIRVARTARGWSQLKLSEVIRIEHGGTLGPAAISDLENGKAVPQLKNVRKLALALGIDPRELMGDTTLMGERAVPQGAPAYAAWEEFLASVPDLTPIEIRVLSQIPFEYEPESYNYLAILQEMRGRPVSRRAPRSRPRNSKTPKA